MKNLLLVLVLSMGILSCANKEDSAKELIKLEWEGKDVQLFLDEPYEMLVEKIDKADNSLIGYEILYRVKWNNSVDTIYYRASFDKDLKTITGNSDSILESEKQKIDETINKNAEIDTLIDIFNVL
ncbi:MAG: hypothetical protein M0O93_06730 [Bacteroidales bacterium]|nr:hypothetical protein [Bacteroidales bacterium]